MQIPLFWLPENVHFFYSDFMHMPAWSLSDMFLKIRFLHYLIISLCVYILSRLFDLIALLTALQYTAILNWNPCIVISLVLPDSSQSTALLIAYYCQFGWIWVILGPTLFNLKYRHLFIDVIHVNCMQNRSRQPAAKHWCVTLWSCNMISVCRRLETVHPLHALFNFMLC